MSLMIGATARPVPTSVPTNAAPPTIMGIQTQGQTVTANPGSWVGMPTGAYAYQWKRAGTNISGATGSTYVLTGADVGQAITVQVIATNVVGPSSPATSASITPNATLSISGSPGSATVGSAYSFTPTKAGGHTPYTAALTGTLPSGLSFNPSTGAITGTPSSSGTAAGLSITLTDADGLTAVLGPFSLVVASSSSAIQTLEIVGPTLLDATGDYSDATTRTGVNGNGWVAKVTMPYLVGQTFDPSKISVVVSDPGYSAANVTTTRTRTLRGGIILRRQYNAQASLQQSNNGVTLTVYFNLTADGAEFATVFQGSTIVSAAAAAGFYGASASGAVPTLTNSSTIAYAKPLFAWLQRHHRLVGSGGAYVEGVAYSQYGMNGQQVAGIEYIGRDAQGTPNVAATQTVNTATLSTLLTKGQPPECYAATVPVTALTQADLCLVNAKVYPWIGDSSAVLDLLNDGVNTSGNWFTANAQTPLRFVNDKSGTWGNTHASVKAGASGGTVQTTESASRATPYPTISAALAAMATANTGKGHNDTSGFVWLMDDGVGGAVEHVIGSALDGQAAGKALTEVRQSPANTATASVVVNAANVGNIPRSSWHVDIRMTSTSYLRGFNTYTSYFCDGTLNQAAGAPAPAWYQTLAIAYNLTHTTNGVFDLTGAEPGVQMLGCVNKGNSADVQSRAHVVIGCDFEHVYLGEIASGTGSPSSQDGKVIANNKLMKVTGSSGAQGIAGLSYAKGFAIVQNIIERSAGTTPAVSIGETTAVGQVFNAIHACNTEVGDRSNILYCDVAGADGVIKQIASRFNLMYERNTKEGVFAARAGLTGNWKLRYDVDCFDCVMKGDNNGQTVPGVGFWLGEYWNTPANANLGFANCTFVADRSRYGTGAGGGDYHPNGASNPVKNKIPTGKSPLKFFQDGASRLNDGSDAAGALAWTA